MTSTEREIDDAKEAVQRERSLRALAGHAWLNEHRDRTVHAAQSVRQPLKVKTPADIGLSRT